MIISPSQWHKVFDDLIQNLSAYKIIEDFLKAKFTCQKSKANTHKETTLNAFSLSFGGANKNIHYHSYILT